MKWAWAVLCFCGFFATAGTAHAKKSTATTVSKQPDAKRKKGTVPARSVGSPDEGSLVGGARISGSKSVRLVGSLHFALPNLVGMLERSADAVAKKFPGSVLTVGDLSARDGGDVDGHRSHESGRDADVGFYLTKSGKPFQPRRFATIDEDGRAVGTPNVRFDDARNWALVESWLTNPRARVLQIFVARHLRTRLLAHAERAGASGSLRSRAAEVLMQPRKALPHDNHFHVRVACPSTDRACINFGKKKKTADARAKKQRRTKLAPKRQPSSRLQVMSSSRR